VGRHQRAPGLVLARLRWPDGGPEVEADEGGGQMEV
jgi:hypothetical protein